MMRSSSTNSAAGKGCATLFLSVFAIAGLVFTAFIGKAAFDTVRPYFWEKMDCVIESSALRDKGDGSEFDVRYTYQVNGRPYSGTRFRMGMAGTLSGEAGQRAAAKYAAGNSATCYVNLSSLAESTLERGSLWMLLVILFPLVFVTIGVGGIVGVWRTKPPAAKAVSERIQPTRGGVLGLRLFGLVFMGVGAGVMYAMLIRPMMKEAAAAKWPEVPCQILTSGVSSHRGSKGGTTYAVAVRYRYEFGGREYTGTKYNFDTGSSSSRDWKYAAVQAHPPGKSTVCRVNPEDPFEAVLSTTSSPDRWFGLLPGLFLVAGLFIFLKAPSMTARNRGTRTGGTSAVPVPLRAANGGPVALKQESAPMTKFVGMLLVALFWNGIVWGIMLSMGRNEWLGRIFLGFFALIGLGLAGGAVYCFLGLFNPQPTLTASAGAVPLGGTLDVQWRFTGNVRRMSRMHISLEAREEATYRRGTSTTTDRNVFASLTVTETGDHGAMSAGSAKLTIPAELMHTFTAPNNKIVWTLRLNGDIPKWPDVSAEFPITVLPREPAALFTEENPAT
jgi:hypothetical protein